MGHKAWLSLWMRKRYTTPSTCYVIKFDGLSNHKEMISNDFRWSSDSERAHRDTSNGHGPVENGADMDENEANH